VTRVVCKGRVLLGWKGPWACEGSLGLTESEKTVFGVGFNEGVNGGLVRWPYLLLPPGGPSRGLGGTSSLRGTNGAVASPFDAGGIEKSLSEAFFG